MNGPDVFRGNAVRAFERAALKVARRQRAEPIERQQVGGGAKLAIFGGCRTERPLREIPAVLDQGAGIRPLAPLCPANGDGLDALAAEDGAASAAARMTAVVGDRRVSDRALAGGTDRRYLKVCAETCLQCR